jgi:polysaccharide export outer membrane protein
MRRALSLLPLLLALSAAGCMHNGPATTVGSERGIFTAPPHSAPGLVTAQPHSERGILLARPDIELKTAGPRAYVMQYRAPAIGGPYAATDATVAVPVAAPLRELAYTLDSGDKLRVIVFGQEGITGTYMVDAGGHVSLPLVGSVPARGRTTQALSKEIADKLKQGYVRDPHVTVEVEAYRPFFILGEVTTPGQYAFVPNMTVETAIAIAGGFAPRADKRIAEVTRQRNKFEVPLNYPLRPGDTIMVKERWF